MPVKLQNQFLVYVGRGNPSRYPTPELAAKKFVEHLNHKVNHVAAKLGVFGNQENAVQNWKALIAALDKELNSVSAPAPVNAPDVSLPKIHEG